MNKGQWILELHPSRQGHRYFFDFASDQDSATLPLKHRIAIADASGRFPDETDDGVLYLDRRRPIRFNEVDLAIIPLLYQDGRETSTIATKEEAHEVAIRFKMRIVQ